MARITSFEVITNSCPDTVWPERDPAQWHQAIGVARQACARIFRDGGSAADAVKAFGLEATSADWSRAVTLIAESLCSARVKRAA
jgi:hypothetical protein